MLNQSDVQTLRQQGMTNLDILKNMGRVVPSAQRAYEGIMKNQKIPEWRKEGLVGKMLDRKVPSNAPSGLGYMAVSGMDAAQDEYDMRQGATDEIVRQLPDIPVVGGMVKGIGDAINRRGDQLRQSLDQMNEDMEHGVPGTAPGFRPANPSDATGKGVWESGAEASLGAINAFAGGIKDVGAEILKPIGSAVMPLLPDHVKKGIEAVGGTVAQLKENVWEPFAADNPEISSGVSAGGNIAGAALAARGVEQVAGATVSAAKAAKTAMDRYDATLPKQIPSQPDIQLGKPVTYDQKILKIPTADGNTVFARGGRLYRAISEEQYQRMLRTGVLEPSAPEVPGMAGRSYFSSDPKLSADLSTGYGNGTRMVSIDARDVKLLTDPHVANAGKSGVSAYTEQPINISKIHLMGDDGAFHSVKATVSSNFERLVQPRRTAAELKELYRQDATLITDHKGGFVKSSKGPGLTVSEKGLASDLKRLVPEIGDKLDDPIRAGPMVQAKIAEKGAALDQSLKDNPFILPKKESLAKVRESVMSAADDFGQDPGVFEAQVKLYKNIREGFPGNGYGERQALKAYDAAVESRFGSSIFEKGTPRAEAVRAVRQASHDVLHDAAARAGIDYLPQIDDMASLYRINENMSSHVTPAVFDSTIKKAARTPAGKAVMQATGVGAGLKVMP